MEVKNVKHELDNVRLNIYLFLVLRRVFSSIYDVSLRWKKYRIITLRKRQWGNSQVVELILTSIHHSLNLRWSLFCIRHGTLSYTRTNTVKRIDLCQRGLRLLPNPELL